MLFCSQCKVYSSQLKLILSLIEQKNLLTFYSIQSWISKNILISIIFNKYLCIYGVSKGTCQGGFLGGMSLTRTTKSVSMWNTYFLKPPGTVAAFALAVLMVIVILWQYKQVKFLTLDMASFCIIFFLPCVTFYFLTWLSVPKFCILFL